MSDDAANGQPPDGPPLGVPSPAPSPDQPKKAAKLEAIGSGRNHWDFLTVAAVAVTIGLLTYFLVNHYTHVGSVVQVLGVIGPVFAAVFGVSVGNSAGKATGKAEGKQEVKAALMPRVNEIAKKSAGLVDTLSHRATSPANSSRWLLQEDFRAQPLELAPDNMDLKSKVADLQGFVEAI